MKTEKDDSTELLPNPHAARYFAAQREAENLRRTVAELEAQLGRYFNHAKATEEVHQRIEWLRQIESVLIKEHEAKSALLQDVYKKFNASQKHDRDIIDFANELSWRAPYKAAWWIAIYLVREPRERLEREIASEQMWISQFNWFEAEAKLRGARVQFEATYGEFREAWDSYSRIEAVLAPMRSGLDERSKEVEVAQQRIAVAKSFQDRLTAEPTPRGRAAVHQECGESLGTQNPRQVIEEETSRIARLGREIAKLEHRAKIEVQRAERRITTIVVDGNNLCYREQDFIGLRALRPLAASPSREFKVQIVFDASICRLLDLGREAIKKQLLPADVHIVEMGRPADETMLDLASNNSGSYVLSNDRFVDYPDREVVASGRVIRFELVKDTLLIADLGLKLSLEQASGPESKRSAAPSRSRAGSQMDTK